MKLADRAPDKGGRTLLAILCVVTAIGPLSIDMYLPALPELSRALGLTPAGGQLTIGAFILGFATGQLAHGPLADRFGRRPPLLAGMVLAALASAGCALAAGDASLLALRFVVGVGASAGLVVARSIVRDLYPRDAAAAAFSVLVMVVGTAPLLAPLVGSQIFAHGGWRAIFWTLAGVAALAAAIATLLPETLPPERRVMGAFRAAARSYGRVLAERRYLGYASAGALIYAGMFGYIAAAPSIFISGYGVSPRDFGLIFGLNAAGFMLGGLLTRTLVKRFGAPFLLGWAGWAALAAGLGMVALAAAGGMNLPMLAAMLFAFATAVGIAGATSAACCLDLFPERAGAASAVFGGLQFGAGTLGTVAVGGFPGNAELVLAIVIAGAAALALILKRAFIPRDAGARRLA